MKILMMQPMILMMMWMIMYLMMFKKKINTKIMSPFECGYNSFTSNLPMSIQFTLLVFVFLLFDIELSILISSNWKTPNMDKSWIITMTTFFLFMTISIIYEMKMKSLKWN